VAFQDGVTSSVVIGLDTLGVTATVDFDDQAAAEADEVEIVTPEGRLPAEVKTPGAESSQLDPQPRFLRRKVFSEFPSARDSASSSSLPFMGRDRRRSRQGGVR